ncbi:MAG TPA: threonine/serine dehydratase [Actinomycetota bacterium]|nr:threonine/serine dehydratase [Actinomycetota bacterium]
MDDHGSLSANSVEAAAGRIVRYVHRTPVLHCASLDELAGRRLYMKAENQQRVGAFKARGAFNALLSMGAAARHSGVLTVSSGNHGQAVALAARVLGGHAVVVMPADATPVKVRAVEALGARVVAEGVTQANREEAVRRLQSETGLPVVHPFDDLRVMAGQGTVGLELTQQCQGLDAVVVPVGGGGLISGIATIIKDRWPKTLVVGVEPKGADDAARSLRTGTRVSLESAPDTVVDGVRSLTIGERPWEVIRELVDDIVTVDDEQTLRAMELLWTRAKTVVEPAGALALAAVLAGKVRGGDVGLVLSGGNVDLDWWAAHRVRSASGLEAESGAVPVPPAGGGGPGDSGYS